MVASLVLGHVLGHDQVVGGVKRIYLLDHCHVEYYCTVWSALLGQGILSWTMREHVPRQCHVLGQGHVTIRQN